jgi:type 1 glutamine amidotransferase
MTMTPKKMFIVTEVAPYTDGPAGVHAVLGQATTAMSELAEMASLDPVAVPQVSRLDDTALRGEGVLCLFTIGETPWSDHQRRAIVEGVTSGRLGVVALHSATDSCHGWDDYEALVGARFDGHPWTTEFVVDVLDRAHPSTAHLGDRWQWHDEVYLFRHLRPDAHVLLEVAPGQLDMNVDGARVPECGFPLAWHFTNGAGRCFYTSLGHFPHAWEIPTYLRHVAGGLSWVLGDVG